MAGALAIAGMVAGALSIVPVIETSDFLTRIPSHETEVLVGAGFQAIMVPACAGFALALHPILRRGSVTLSLGFVGFRLIAAMFHLVGVVLLPLFLVLGQDLVQDGAADLANLEVLGELLRSGRDLVNHVALILALSLGDLLLFWILYQWRLVPRWLATWGFIGIGLTVLASLLVLFGRTGVVTALYLAMNAPLAVHGLALAVWLIARGVDTSSLDPRRGTSSPMAGAG